MSLALLTLAPLLSRIMCAFGGEDPVKGQPWYHERLSWNAAHDAGWDVGSGAGDEGTAAAALAWHTDYVDSYLYNPLWMAAGGIPRVKASMLVHKDLIKVHFDDLPSTRQVQLMWDRYLGGTLAGVLWAADRGDVTAARHLVGVGLHAMQDFYSHSNWVDDAGRRRLTWFESLRAYTPAQREAMQLYTGTYELPDHMGVRPHGKLAIDCAVLRQLVGSTVMNLLCAGVSPLSNTGLCVRWRECASSAVPARPRTVLGVPLPENVVWIEPPGIALDSSWITAISIQTRGLTSQMTPQDLFNGVLALAERHSTQWLLLLEQAVRAAGHGAFWGRVKAERRTGERHVPDLEPVKAYLGGFTPDLVQFEQAHRLLLTFPSAGRYPPEPQGTDEGWYLRLEIRTGTDFGAGTDADIIATVDGRAYLLDHQSERTPGGGADEWRILEHNDFEAGDHTAYVVGPLPSRPSSLSLRNNAASGWSVVAGAWEDLKRGVSSLLETVGDLLLSIIGGHADFVAGAHRAYSWHDLVAIAGRTSTFRFRCDGRDEGIYDVEGTVTVAHTSTGVSAGIRLSRLYCIKESTWDRGSSSDEPFVLMLFQSPASGALRSHRVGPYSDVDTGENRTIDMGTVWMDVPRYGGLIVAVQVWESDDEGDSGRAKLQSELASRYGSATVNERSRFLDAIGSATAPDWKLATIDAYAFRRGSTVETVQLVSNRRIDRWVEAGTSVAIPFDAAPTRQVAIPATVPVTPVDGTLLRERSGAIHATYGGAPFHVPDPQTLAAFFGARQPRQVWDGSIATLSRLPADGTLLREHSGAAVWVVYGGSRLWVPDPQTFDRYFSWSDVRVLWDGACSWIPLNAPVDGTLLREESGAVWVVYGRARFHVPDPATLTRLFAGAPIRQVWTGAVTPIATVPVDGTLLREAADGPVYVIRKGRKSVTTKFTGTVHLLWPGALSTIPG